MRAQAVLKQALLLALASACANAACIPFTEAPKRIGDSVCVTGKVLKVAVSQRSGTHFLNFCDDYRNCAFSVVVFSRDLEKVGDVRALEGQTIEIHGKIKDYKGQAEIVLESAKQLSGASAKLPPLPKHYDAETRGKYSPGQFKTAKNKDKSENKKKPKDKGLPTDGSDQQ